jgi:hypothetical protein
LEKNSKTAYKVSNKWLKNVDVGNDVYTSIKKSQFEIPCVPGCAKIWQSEDLK